MKNFSIKAENIGKRYQLGTGRRYGTLKEAISRWIKPSQNKKQFLSEAESSMWALNDISFEISQGEIVGLVGRNGAGKSTLLKIIAGITPPTCGRAEIAGQIGCLLEVGAGFHPFLSGRENIFLSGSILGISRADIKHKFDEIVAFAEIEQFIDTQVKYYSSGMYTRLAFAVAAHMVVDILIVDEVLAVGDIAFQKKCLGKIDDVASDGRTILFVSHNMATIQRLCNRGLLLHHGKIIMDANINSIVSEYLQNFCDTPSQRTWQPEDAPGDDCIQLLSVRAINLTEKTIQTTDLQETVGIEIKYLIKKIHQWPVVILHFYDAQWLHLFSSHDFYQKQKISFRSSSREISETCWIHGQLFNQGRININIELSSLNPRKNHVAINDVVSFEVIDQRSLEQMKGPFGGHWPGVIRPTLKWEM
ncbi:MAG: ATP-binding cassette domain-containing protein [Candidatus Magnetomorum sp.]|nr:ATP-binding cassette domain-containing protein [Candidatus Magnetomorum sp.]